MSRGRSNHRSQHARKRTILDPRKQGVSQKSEDPAGRRVRQVLVRARRRRDAAREVALPVRSAGVRQRALATDPPGALRQPAALPEVLDGGLPALVGAEGEVVHQEHWAVTSDLHETLEA